MYPSQFKDSRRQIPLCDSGNTLSKFELIFDEKLEKEYLLTLRKAIDGVPEQEDEKLVGEEPMQIADESPVEFGQQQTSPNNCL